jgi:hypothetical protein
MMDQRQVVNLIVAVVALGATAALIVVVWLNRYDAVLTELVVKNFAAIVGLPFAFISAFVVVALLRQSDSAIEFKGLGVEFRGAAGEIILWLFCFLAITGAIKLLWRT